MIWVWVLFLTWTDGNIPDQLPAASLVDCFQTGRQLQESGLVSKFRCDMIEKKR